MGFTWGVNRDLTGISWDFMGFNPEDRLLRIQKFGFEWDLVGFGFDNQEW